MAPCHLMRLWVRFKRVDSSFILLKNLEQESVYSRVVPLQRSGASFFHIYLCARVSKSGDHQEHNWHTTKLFKHTSGNNQALQAQNLQQPSCSINAIIRILRTDRVVYNLSVLCDMSALSFRQQDGSCEALVVQVWPLRYPLSASLICRPHRQTALTSTAASPYTLIF